MKTILKNWRTTLAGVITFLTGVPGFVQALQAWAQGKPVDWKQVLVSVALAAGGGGLIAAKDGNVHSTTTEVGAAK